MEESSVAAKHVSSEGQLTPVRFALEPTLSVRQFAPPSVVVTESPAVPPAVHTLLLEQLIALKDPSDPPDRSAARSKLSDQLAPVLVVS
jgi:hypothetical protein